MAAQLLIYERAVPVNASRHADWSVKSGADFGFASHVNAVPLMASEFRAAASDFTIVFTGTQESLMPAVILGGLDSVQGALVGGLIIGLFEITAGQYLSGQAGTLGSGYPLIVPYVVMIVGLLVRPYGFFGTPEVRRV